MVLTEEDKEYELIPLSPIRRLERRLERLESSHGSGGFSKDVISDIVDIVRMNQMLVDELAKSNDALRIELAKLPGRLDELITNMKELVSFIKSSGEQEVTGLTPEAIKPVVDKLDEIVQSNKKLTEKNDTMIELLDEVSKKMRRPMLKPSVVLPHQQQPPLTQPRNMPLKL